MNELISCPKNEGSITREACKKIAELSLCNREKRRSCGALAHRSRNECPQCGRPTNGDKHCLLHERITCPMNDYQVSKDYCMRVQEKALCMPCKHYKEK